MENFIYKLLEQQTLNETSHLNEGFLHIANKFFLWLGFGKPAHPLMKTARKAFGTCQRACGLAYQDISSYSTKSSTEKDIDTQKKELIETIKANPERGKCLMVCYFDLMRATRDVIKENQKDICSHNVNEDLCEKWVEKNIPEIEAIIKAMGNAVKLMQGVKSEEVHKIKKVVDILNKIL